MNIDTKKKLEEMTILDVKNIITFDKSQGIGKCLCGMVDCWYGMKLGEGHAVAIQYSLDKLGEELLNLNK